MAHTQSSLDDIANTPCGDRSQLWGVRRAVPSAKGNDNHSGGVAGGSQPVPGGIHKGLGYARRSFVRTPGLGHLAALVHRLACSVPGVRE